MTETRFPSSAAVSARRGRGVSPLVHHGDVADLAREPWSPRFSVVARAVADAARGLGLDAPWFRSPPALPGVDRSVRRLADGRCIVAVRACGRPFDAVVSDLVDGVIVANRLEGDRAAAVRRALLHLTAPMGCAA